MPRDKEFQPLIKEVALSGFFVNYVVYLNKCYNNLESA